MSAPSAAASELLFLYTPLHELGQYGQHSGKEKVQVTIYKGTTRNVRYAQIGYLVRHDQQNIKTNDKSHYFAPSPFNSHKKIPEVHETN